MKPTQRQRITAKLKADGEVTSVWAVQNFILRLSERIRELEQEGWTFRKSFIVVDGKRTQNYRYEVVERPARVVYRRVVVDGEEVMRRELA